MATFMVTRRAARGEKPKQLRRRGVIPMVVIDRDHQGHLAQASSDDIKKAIRGADAHGMIDLGFEGETGTVKAMVKAIDNDPLSRQIISVTLQEVNDGDTVKTELPVVATGHSDVSDRSDVILTAVTTEVRVRAKVANLPEAIEVDVSKLAPGDHLRAGDVALPEGVELLSSPDAILFNVAQLGAAELEDADAPVAPVETEAAAEPEA